MTYRPFLTCLTLLVVLPLQLPAAPKPWPRDIPMEKGVMTVYQPQVDQLKGNVVEGRAAVAYSTNENAEPIFGAIWLKGTIDVDRRENRVDFRTLEVVQTRFPEGSEDIGTAFQQTIATGMQQWNLSASFEDIKTSLAASEQAVAAAKRYKHDVPDILVRDHPALLVSIEGKERLQDVEGSTLQTVVNTPYPILYDNASRTWHLNAAQGVWYTATDVDGPWSVNSAPPEEAVRVVEASKSNEKGAKDKPAAANDTVPEIIVVHEPSELVVTEGKADFAPITDGLLGITNSETPVFLLLEDQTYLLNISGRWYEAKQMSGPWAYLPTEELPDTFQQIPTDSDFANTRALVPGTDEAAEAMMDTAIPQTATVKRGIVDIEVLYDGNPRFESVKGTSLKFAINASETVIQADKTFYLVKDAVWYTSAKPEGPWEVSDHAPPGIQGVDPSSPVYNTKYVYIYGSTPEVVYVGYTPGYVCSYIYGPTVIYGTGWVYAPWYGPRYYYPRHATWGVTVRYSSAYGWGFGLSWSSGPFTVGWYAGGGWHSPWYGPGYWGPGRYRPSVNIGDINIDRDVNINVDRNTLEQNLYARKDQVANIANIERPDKGAIRDKAGAIAAGGIAGGAAVGAIKDREKPENLDKVKDRANNIYTDRDGNVFRKDGDEWNQNIGGKWQSVDKDRLPASRPSTRPSRPETRPAIPETRPPRPETRPVPRPETRPAPAPRPQVPSGYQRPSSLERQAHARDRASSLNRSATRMPAGGMQRSGGGGGMRRR